MEIIDSKNYTAWFSRLPEYSAQKKYLAFYNSWTDSLTFDPRYMQNPIDDHMVHRGDGVFEALRLINGKFYILDAHLNRMQDSCDKIGIKMPLSKNEISEKLNQIAQELNTRFEIKNSVLRIFVSRGPGGFTTDPRECVSSQLYILFLDFQLPPVEKFLKGVTVIRSEIPIKPSFWPTVKACNYLPNVLMKMEATQLGCDFTLAFDNEGHMAECSTENMMVVTENNILVHPPIQHILRGTTMVRVMELAEKHGIIKTEVRMIKSEEVNSAKELFIVGTTHDILPVTTYNNKPVNDGKVGPMAQKLLQLLRNDQI